MSKKTSIGYVSQHLPPNDREALARAALTPIPTRDPIARIRAIDAVSAQIRARNPELFRIGGGAES
jgi:hypothetical protein